LVEVCIMDQLIKICSSQSEDVPCQQMDTLLSVHEMDLQMLNTGLFEVLAV
jgi:hypothetical protein